MNAYHETGKVPEQKGGGGSSSGGSRSYETVAYGVTLGRWDKGDPVKDWQDFLVSQGYSLGDAGVDGYFGADTEGPTEAFQEKHGLVPDGLAGDKTIAKAEELGLEWTRKPKSKPKPKVTQINRGWQVGQGHDPPRAGGTRHPRGRRGVVPVRRVQDAEPRPPVRLGMDQQPPLVQRHRSPPAEAGCERGWAYRPDDDPGTPAEARHPRRWARVQPVRHGPSAPAQPQCREALVTRTLLALAGITLGVCWAFVVGSLIFLFILL